MRTIRGIPAAKSQGYSGRHASVRRRLQAPDTLHREALVRDRELPHEEDDGQQSQK